MRQSLLAGLLSVGLALPVRAQPQLEEAMAFFSNVAVSHTNPVISSSAREILFRLRQQEIPNVWITVPLLASRHNQLLVSAGMNRQTVGMFIIDTGASYTMITPRTAEKLGIQVTPETPHISLTTANGPIRVPKVRLKHLTIGELERQNILVVIHDIGPDPLLAGLLGMNFFEDVDFSVRENHLMLGIRAGAPEKTNGPPAKKDPLSRVE